MASLADLQDALVNAHAAGDADAATALANEIVRMQGANSAPAPIRPMAPPTAMEQALAKLPSLPGWLAERGGVVGRTMMGAADPGVGLFQLGANAIGQGDAVNQRVKDVESQYQTSRQGQGSFGFDPLRLGGNVGISFMAPNLAAARGAGMFSNGIRSTLTGMGFGAAQPVSGDDYWDQKRQDIGVGAVGGALATPIAAAASRVVQPNVRPDVKTLIDEGITLTPGQILGGGFQRAEDALTSVPVMGDAIRNAKNRTIQDFNRATYQRAVGPIGASAADFPIGPEGVLAVKNTLGDAYNALLPKLNFAEDAPFVAGLNKVEQMAATLPPDQARQFRTLLETNLGRATPTGRMDGQTFKQVEESLGGAARNFRASGNPDQRNLGAALDETLTLFRDALARSNPQSAGELANINKGYANYARIRRAAASAGDKSEGFTPAQLSGAVRGLDKSAGKGATATGTALMQDLSDAGRAVLPPTVSDSGTPLRQAFQYGLGGLLGIGGMAPVFPAVAAGAASAAPYAVGGLLAGTLPYTKTGQALMQGLLTKRPEQAPAVADFLRRYGPLLGSMLAPALEARTY